MTANDSNCYFNYLHNLVDEYHNIYHRSVGKKPVDAKVYDRVRSTKNKNIFSKGYIENCSKEIPLI